METKLEHWPLERLTEYARNPRKNDHAVDRVAAAIREFGFKVPVVARSDGTVVDGHLRLKAARKLGLESVPVLLADDLTDAQVKAFRISVNRMAELADWDTELLKLEFDELQELDFDLDLTGFDEDEIKALEVLDEPLPVEGENAGSTASLADKFGIPPFSVLNAREGWWQNRKRGWVSLGIRSELGRCDQLIFEEPKDTKVQRVHTIEEGGKTWKEVRAALRHAIKVSGLTGAQVDKHCGTVGMVGHWIGDSQPSIPTPEKWEKLREVLPHLPKTWDREMLETEEVEADCNGTARQVYEKSGTGTSLFDPVLCELAYKWFSPSGSTVLDPFAGGSVRGIVASRLGRQYIGVELRPEQVDANRVQGDDLCPDLPPVWHCGDSRNIDRICADVQADFIFSCPPYADLEVYSDDPKDLSTLKYEEFKPAYFEIIAKACAQLKQDRFACFVVGDVRDKRGNYYNFVGDTVEAFRAAGLHYYNEAILVTSVGSLPIRAGKQFSSGRKLGKTHQNVLVFVKGDGKRAAQACGDCEFGEIPEEAHSDLGEPL